MTEKNKGEKLKMAGSRRDVLSVEARPQIHSRVDMAHWHAQRWKKTPCKQWSACEIIRGTLTTAITANLHTNEQKKIYGNYTYDWIKTFIHTCTQWNAHFHTSVLIRLHKQYSGKKDTQIHTLPLSQWTGRVQAAPASMYYDMNTQTDLYATFILTYILSAQCKHYHEISCYYANNLIQLATPWVTTCSWNTGNNHWYELTGKDRIQWLGLEESQEKKSVEGDREKEETQQIRSDGKMRWEENRWKQKRETQDIECKVGEVQSRQHHGASPAERN